MVEELDQFNARLMQVVAQRTHELAKLHAQLETTLENVDQGIVMIDPDGRIAVFNEKFLEMTGLPRSACEGYPSFRSIVELMIENGEFDPMGEAFKAWVRRKGRIDRSMPFSACGPMALCCRCNACRLADGGQVRTLSDVTSHVRRSNELSATKDMLETTLNSVAQGIMKVDPQGRIVFFNRRVIDLLGFPEGMIHEGVTVSELIRWQFEAGEFEGFPDEQLDRIKSGDPGVDIEQFVRAAPEWPLHPVQHHPPAGWSYVRTFTDVTEAREREEAVARAHEEYRSLFENSIVGIFRSTLDGKQLRANPALVRMNGYETEADMLAQVNDIARQWYVDPNRRNEFATLMNRDGRTTDFISEVFRTKPGIGSGFRNRRGWCATKRVTRPIMKAWWWTLRSAGAPRRRLPISPCMTC